MNSQLVHPRPQGFQGEPVFDVNGILRVDGKDHAAELPVIFDRQIFIFFIDIFRVQQGALFLRNLKAVQQNFSLHLWSLIILPKSPRDLPLRPLILVIPAKQLRPHIPMTILVEDIRTGEVLILSVRRINHIEDGQLFVDRDPLNLPASGLLLNAQSAQNFFPLAKILAMLNSDDSSTDNFSATLFLGEILPSDFSPKDRGSMENIESLGVVDFDFMSDVRTFNDGGVVSKAGLHQVDSLVDARVLIHVARFIILI